MLIVPRSSWTHDGPVRKLTNVVHTHMEVHHTAGKLTGTSGAVKELQGVYDYHVDTKGWSDIFYNLAVDANGVVYSARGIGNKSHGSVLTVVVLGNFMTDELPGAVKKALRDINDYMGFDLETIDWHSARGTRDGIYQSACPGTNMIAWLKAGLPLEVPEMDNTAYVTRLYDAVLGRVPDAEGLAHWVKNLDAGNITPLGVAVEFLGVARAANDAELAALKAGLDASVPALGSANVADQARAVFYEELKALANSTA